jgi:hypothetical protein
LRLLALQPDALALHRFFMMAAPRFPELAKLFVERNRHRIIGEIVRVLTVYADRTEIEAEHPQMLAEHPQFPRRAKSVPAVRPGR